MAQLATPSRHLDHLVKPDIRPVADGRKNLRAGQLMLYPRAPEVDAALTAGVPLAEVAPVWRVLDAKSPALKKFSCDPAFILTQRAREGLS